MTPAVFSFALDPYWTIPLVGGVGFFAAVMLGRWLLAPRDTGQGDRVPLRSFLDGVTQDRRATPRRKGNTVEIQFKRDDDPETVTGTVIDRSQGGLSVLVDRPMEEGGVWKIRATLASPTTPWTAVEVRSCQREGTRYKLGCQFDGMPNWNLLLQFG